MSKLFVGIDVSEARFDVAFRNSNAQPVRFDSPFSNSTEGIRDLVNCCIASASLIGKKTKIIVGMESTSNFHKNLEKAFRNSSRTFEIHIINPYTIKQFKKMNLKVCKTDKLDAHMIALYLIKMTPKPSFESLPFQEELKTLTRLRLSFKHESNRYISRLKSLLRIYFPGYKKYLGKKMPKKFLIAFSRFATPNAFLSQSVESLSKIAIGPRHRIGKTFAENLVKLAQKAPDSSVPEQIAGIIKWSAQRILEIKSQIDCLDQQIEKMVEDFFPDHNLLSIPGIGPVTCATIIAEVGDIKRFESPEKFIGYIGLYPVIWESGECKTSFKMTSKGNKYLKTAFLVSTASARKSNPVIRQMYDRLRARGKSKKAAGGAIARKMALIVYAILYQNQPWNPKKAAQGLAKSEEMRKDNTKVKENGRFNEVLPQSAVYAAQPSNGGSMKSLRSPNIIIQSGDANGNP